MEALSKKSSASNSQLSNSNDREIYENTCTYISNTDENTSNNVTVLYNESMKVIGDYVIIKMLGKGSSAKVFLCSHKKTKKKVAIKVINRNNSIVNRTRILREIVIGTVLNHPHIIKVIEFLYDQKYFYLVFEYADGMLLYDLVLKSNVKKGKGLQIEKIRKYFRQIISAVDYLHRNSIVHRDLKIENIIVNANDNIKIIDFGLSNFYDSKGILDTFCGSLYFAAPELLLGHEYHGPEIDIWSLGVVLFVMVYGKVPFDDDSIHHLQNKIKNCEFKFPKHRNCDDEIEDLIINMILLDPNSRFGIEDIKNSVWLNENYDAVIENYYINKLPIKKLNKEFVFILENLISFQFNNIKEELENYVDICSYSTGKLERKYWEQRPIVSLYYLLAQTLTQNKGFYIEKSKKLYWQTSPILEYLNSENSNIKCIKEFLKFLNESTPTINREPESISSNFQNFPITRRSFIKGIVEGIKVKGVQEEALKKKLVRLFLKHNITYVVDKKAFNCSFYHNNTETHFKVSIFFNIILGEHYVALKSMNKESKYFKDVKKIIKTNIVE